MKEFEVLKPTNFFSSEKPLKIYDSRGILFYSDSFTKNFRGFFSLPKGIFKTANNLITTDKGKKDPNKIVLPPYERNFHHNFDEFVISFGDNPSKCTINHREKTILFDKSFLKFPSYVLYFILGHEMGHNYYSTEEYADLYGAKQMLKWGFNVSQIGYAPLTSLSDNNYGRKKLLTDYLIKIYG